MQGKNENSVVENRHAETEAKRRVRQTGRGGLTIHTRYLFRIDGITGSTDMSLSKLQELADVG